MSASIFDGMSDARPLAHPFPLRGMLGFFNAPVDNRDITTETST